MRRFLILLLCFWVANASYSQSPYAELALESNNIKDIQAFEVRDSIFLTFSEKQVRKCYWIDGSGTTHAIFLNSAFDFRICGIQKEGDTTFIYYVKEELDRVLRIHVFKQPSGGGNVYSGARPVTLSGDVMAMDVDDGELIVVSYLKETNKVGIVSIRRGIKASSVEVDMPKRFSRYDDGSGLLSDNGLTTIAQGAAPTKIYREGRSIILTIDDDRDRAENSVTNVVRVNLGTGENTLYAIPGPEGIFTSFYHRDKLFRLATSTNTFQWFVYDLQTGAALYSKELKRSKSLQSEKVFFRSAESFEVRYAPLYHMINYYAKPSIIIETIPNTKDVRIVTGKFQNAKDVTVVGGLNPLAILTGLVVHNVINQLEPRPGVNEYFYLTGNLQKGFEFEPVEHNPTPSLRQIIDDYEISRTSGVPEGEDKWNWFLQYRGYLELEDGALGIYQEKRKNVKKLIFLKYKRG